MLDKVNRFCDWKGELCEEEEDYPSYDTDDDEEEWKCENTRPYDNVVSFTEVILGSFPSPDIYISCI